jgi:uncharacterized membrane protein (UPF0136 family)
MGFKARPRHGNVLDAVRELRSRGAHDEASRVAHQILVDAGFGETRVDQGGGNWLGTPKPIPLPEDLTPPQRKLAHELASIDGLAVLDVAVPPSGWCRRRWLGLDSGGVLERSVDFDDGSRSQVPLWRALSILRARNADDESRALVASLGLSKHELLELTTEVELRAYALSAGVCFPWAGRGFEPFPISHVDADCREWAISTANRLVPLYSSETMRPDRNLSDHVPPMLSWLVLAALVRSKTRFRQGWEILLRLAFQPTEYVTLTKGALRLIDEERRVPAILAALGAVMPSFGVAAVLAHLAQCPSEMLVDYILGHCDGLQPKQQREVLRTLNSMSKTVAEIRGPLKRYRSGRPAPMVLTVASVLQPTRTDQLTEIQHEQLARAGALYDGRTLSAAERLSGGVEDHSFLGSLTIRELTDASGRHVYSVYEYMVDSGSVFKAGTTEEVAEIIQCGLECDDRRLHDALDLVLGR